MGHFQKVICMDCERLIRHQQCTTEMAGKTSHGLCDDCYEKREKELDEQEVDNGKNIFRD